MRTNPLILTCSLLAASATLVSCSLGDISRDDPDVDGPGFNNGNTSISKDITLEGLTDFDVTFDYSALSESESIPSGDEDYYENAVSAGDFAGTVTITYNGENDATVDGSVSGKISVDGGNVVVDASKSYRYILKGASSNGRFKLYSSKKSAIILDGVSLTYPTGAAINVQSKKRTFLVLSNGSENSLTDGSSYVTEYDPSDPASAEKQKGCLYTKSQLIISGNGRLDIHANYKHGIDTKDYLRIRPGVSLSVDAVNGNCIKCESTDEGKGIMIEGGVLNLNDSAPAGKGLSSDGEITVNGGRITVITSGDGEWDGDDADIKDVSGAACLKADMTLTVNGGDLWLKSTGKGGKGINGDSDINIKGGSVHVITTGDVYSYKYNSKSYETSPKGIKTDTNVNVDGGKVFVRATGTKEGSEGIEAKLVYTQSGGEVMVCSADDGVNTGYSSESLREKQSMGYDVTGLKADSGQIVIKGGCLLSVSSDNDAIDSNGTISISGGTVSLFGSGAPETSFDCDQNEFSITGGTLLGFGGSGPSSPTESKCSQPVAIFYASATAGNTLEVKDSKGNSIFTSVVPRTYSNAAVLISSPNMSKGSSYKIGNSSVTCSSSSWVTSNVSQMGGFGGPGFGR